ncbi:MAG: class I SAM-dependent methyltransferase, partial [Myxococcales bacterium]|nr:class I SAM-dependent methyltransferase [Myxococcales bacterium]
MSRGTLKRIRSACEALGLEDGVAERLDSYALLVVKWGQRVNLVGRPELEFVREQLILGSLQLLACGELKPESGRLVDIGSGAGIPAIPLAIVFPGLAVEAVERRRKRIAFMEHCRRELGLRNLTVSEQD